MLLSEYMKRVNRLLGDTMFERFNPYDVIAWINEGRQQVASEGECIRGQINFNTTAQQELYQHSVVFAPSSLPAGVGNVVTVVSISLNSQPNRPNINLEGRPWEWFDFYFRKLGQDNPTAPTAWSQFQQGVGGSFYLAPTPDAIYTMTADVIELPTDLINNQSIDLIPAPWTDAVPFYACHLALHGENIYDEAEKMLTSFEFYMNRARSGVTPFIQPINYPGRARSRTSPAASPVDLMQPAQPTPSGRGGA